MLEDDEPTLQKIDDYQKPMPKQKQRLLTKIAIIIGSAIALYLIIGMALGQLS